MSDSLLVEQKFGFVIPVYNHGAALESVVKNLVQYNFPIIVVDDGNDEKNKAFINDVAARYELITLLVHSKNKGKGEAMKTAVFASALFEILGYETSPKYSENRGDIIQLIMLDNEEKLIRFCAGVQSGSAVDSFVQPMPSDMPGYESQVIMAAGAFTLGSSIELSADAPLREPYAVWLQGGLNFHAGKLGIMIAADKVLSGEKVFS